MMRKRTIVLASGCLLLCLSLWAGEKKSYSELRFAVSKEESGKPVRNASVILHPVDKNGKQAKGGMQLKTDGEGKTGFDGVPYGRLRIQVIAPGLQTFGQDFEINQPQQEFTIKMKRPQEQYSIYK